MRVEWVGGPNDGLVVDYPGAVDLIVIVTPVDPVESVTLESVTLEDAAEALYNLGTSQRVSVPVRDGKAMWADREPKS